MKANAQVRFMVRVREIIRWTLLFWGKNHARSPVTSVINLRVKRKVFIEYVCRIQIFSQYLQLLASPCLSTFPTEFWTVVQFHLLYLSWYWHSVRPICVPSTTFSTISGSFRQTSRWLELPLNFFDLLQMALRSNVSGLPTTLVG